MEFIQLFEQFIVEGADTQILHFKDIYSYLLFQCEYSGQVSDGKGKGISGSASSFPAGLRLSRDP